MGLADDPATDARNDQRERMVMATANDVLPLHLSKDPIFVALNNHAFVDTHCHNVVEKAISLRYELAFSEAHSDALDDAVHTLCFKRSIREIGELLGCDGDFDTVMEMRKTLGEEAMARKCFEAAGISALLLDDGLRAKGMRSLQWHKKHVPLVRRVLRVEAVAEDILSEVLSEGGSDLTLNEFESKLRAALDPLPESVVAFKSIAAYRSGLDIDPNVSRNHATMALGNLMSASPRSEDGMRITDKALVDFIFVVALEVATKYKIPLQIHTGFGDKDLDLRLANPTHLRRVLDDNRFRHSCIVLLHASYPFMREAGWLASVYPQVYLDLGLAVPKLSVHGMTNAVKELLELAPINKVMASTDGYFFPETFFLGARWMKRILAQVLRDSVSDGDLTQGEAIIAGKRILSDNALRIYNLTLQGNGCCQNACQGNGEIVLNQQAPMMEPSEMLCTSTLSKQHELVRVIWSDIAGFRRCKAVPKSRYEDVTKNEGIGVCKGDLAAVTPFDTIPPDCGYGPYGEVRLIPEENTRRRVPWCPDHDMVLADMHEIPGTPWESCPRSNLLRMLALLKNEFGLELRTGFESEFFLLKEPKSQTGDGKWIPVDDTNYAVSSGFDLLAPLLSDMCKALGSLKIPIDVVHAEGGPGQFEIVQTYSDPLSAADNILYLRETVTALAVRKGLRATFMPKYFPDKGGSGCHLHVSLWKDGKNVFAGSPLDKGTKWGVSALGQNFIAGLLCHLPALLAVIAPSPNSYERLVPGFWSGAFRCWGIENREAPLRTSCPPGTALGVASNVELKSQDGCANPYLTLAVVAAAGMDGMRKHMCLSEPFEGDPCTSPKPPPRLPSTLDEAVAELESNSVVQSGLGKTLTKAVIAVRKFDSDYQRKVGKEAFTEMLVSRH